MKKTAILIALSLFSLLIIAQNPGGYYNSINEKQERQLKTALSKIIVNHTVLRYNDMWRYYPVTDVREDGRTIWDMYSNTVRYYSESLGQSTSGIQREHSLPKSWWAISSEVERYAAHNDLHHLYPSDGEANQRKSNFMLGEVASPTFDNGVSKVGRNTYDYPGAPNANAFEPTDEYKGDFARTYFYMVTCYEDYAQQWRSDALNMFNKEIYPVLQPWAVDMLLKWHRNDPVSPKEINRNNAVHEIQSNRNPFIDYPQLVEYIWGDSVDYVFNLPGYVEPGEPTLDTPVNLSEIYLGETQRNVEVTRTIQLKGADLTGNISTMLWGENANYFDLVVTGISADLVNSEGGYQLEITYNPREYGEHSTSLIIEGGGMSGTVMVYLKAICSAGSSIDTIDPTSPDLYVDGRTITFRTYDPTMQVRIFNSSGMQVYGELCSGDWQYFHCQQPGVYIVSINNKARKVIVQ